MQTKEETRAEQNPRAYGTSTSTVDPIEPSPFWLCQIHFYVSAPGDLAC